MILYEVDFTKNKKEDDVPRTKPAEIITLQQKKEDITTCIMNACNLFNSGNLLQSAYEFNKAYEMDAQKDHTSLVDVSILGIINVKLSNFEIAQKYLLKSLSLKIVPTIVVMLYHNALYLKNFKLAKKIKQEFHNEIDFKNLCLVKNDSYVIYDEKYNFKKLLNELIQQLNCKNFTSIVPLFDVLNIVDTSNPYLRQIEKDLIEKIDRKYALNFTPSLAKFRLNEIDAFLKSKNKDFNEIELNGLVRFLFENCKLEKFSSYIMSFLKLENLPLNFIWQCEDVLFNSCGEDKKLFLMQQLLIEKRFHVHSFGIFLKDQLYILKGVSELRQLRALNEKLYKSFNLALCDVLSSTKQKPMHKFYIEVYMQRIIKRLICNIKNGELKTDRISVDKLRRCFFILLTNHLLNCQCDFNDEMKSLNSIFKKLGFDFDFFKKIAGKENVILVDFT